MVELTVGFLNSLSSGGWLDLHRKSKNKNHQQAKLPSPNLPSWASHRASARSLRFPRPPPDGSIEQHSSPCPASFSSSFSSPPTKTYPRASICFMSKEASDRKKHPDCQMGPCDIWEGQPKVRCWGNPLDLDTVFSHCEPGSD